MYPNNTIIQWNCNGVASRINQGELQRLIADHNPMCLCIQHLGKYNTNIKNYTLASQSIHSTNELGTAIYIHNDVMYDQTVVTSSQCQYTATTLNLGTKSNITICNFYNQPKFNYNLKDLKPIITSLPKPLLLVGDTNAHSPMWDESCTAADNAGQILEDIFEENDMICLNEENIHTYVSHTNGTTSSIDIAACSANVAHAFEWNAIEDRYSSDHHPIAITCLQRGQPPPPPVERFNTERADWNEYKRIISNNLSEFDEDNNINNSLKILTDCIIDAATQAIHMTGRKQLKRTVPWWNKELEELLKLKHKISSRLTHAKRKLDKLANETRLSDAQLRKVADLTIEIRATKPALNKITAMFKRKATRAKAESWKTYVSGLNARTPIKKIWKKFRKITGTQTRPTRRALVVNGNKLTQTEEICNAIGEKLEQVSSDQHYDPQFRRLKKETEKNEIKFKKQENNVKSYNEVFTHEELHHALKNTNKSAPGKDKIDFSMIKQLPPNGLEYLFKLYNKIWTDGVFPDEWRHAVVVPIPKPGKDHSNPSNYRPISLTSCMCKVMEKMVNLRLTWLLKEKQIISPTQFGAEKGRSTIEPLIQLEEHIRHAFNNKTPTIAIFFDIEKAYDATWKYPILKKLKDEGIDGQLPIFLQNFMSNRTFQIRIDNTYSKVFAQVNGIAQGSVLSCTAFKLAVNSIIDDLPENVKKSIFMDDFAAYCSSKKLRYATRILNILLRKLENWSKQTGFKFSLDKTKAVAFYRDKRWVKDQPINLIFFGKNIEVLEVHKFLGIIFDSHLNFKAHIEYTRIKCKKALNLINKLSHTSWGADRQTLKMIYKATVRSILDYGCEIYSSATEVALQRLDPLQSEGLRLITGAFRSSPVDSLQVESGEPPLNIHRDLILMKTKVRLMNNLSPTTELFGKADTYWKPDGTEGIAPYPTRANRVLNNVDCEINAPMMVNKPPAWQAMRAHVCLELTNTCMKNINPYVSKIEAMRHIRSKGRHIAIFTDGSKSDTGVGSAAVSTIEARSMALPKYASIFTAELKAIESALKIIENSDYRRYVVYSDSKSAIEALQQFEPSNTVTNSIQKLIHELLSQRNIQIELCWIPAHVGIPGNEHADRAAKEASSLPVNPTQLPNTDYVPLLRNEARRRWQHQWRYLTTANKLREIKEDVGEWESSHNENRRIEVILTRLRIGHTHMTHANLMTRPPGPLPQCDLCGATLTVKHVLGQCPRTREARNRIFGNKDLKEILAEGKRYSTAEIITFLKEAKLLDKI